MSVFGLVRAVCVACVCVAGRCVLFVFDGFAVFLLYEVYLLCVSVVLLCLVCVVCLCGAVCVVVFDMCGVPGCLFVLVLFVLLGCCVGLGCLGPFVFAVVGLSVWCLLCVG